MKFKAIEYFLENYVIDTELERGVEKNELYQKEIFKYEYENIMNLFKLHLFTRKAS